VRSSLIARNYAETLFELAQRHGGAPTVESFGAALDGIAELVRREPRVRRFLDTPMVDAEAKKDALRKALSGNVPPLFLSFVLVVVEKRRQALLSEISGAYAEIVDRSLGRVRAEVLLPTEPDEALKQEITRSLSRQVGGEVLPTFRIDPSMIGGIVIRVGDRVLDGSVRSRLGALRRRLLDADVSHAATA
jgi:F-type H+-transporting ATPase subunit delta